jgi:hypothetical protein
MIVLIFNIRCKSSGVVMAVLCVVTVEAKIRVILLSIFKLQPLSLNTLEVGVAIIATSEK